ncbi:MAG: glycosyltransferase family 2 protein, partial [Phycisphaeraceae bacterium]|nr:glycosyltransferase family 2 protein [Phycisphaeraceae bacterium]
MNEDQSIRPVVVCPTYNNASTLIEVLSGVRDEGFELIVVDDGCTDRTPQLLEEFKASQPDGAVRIVRHEQNKGKAAALQSGFQTARDAGFTHAITIDTDGQHDPASLGDLAAEMRAHPRALIIGTRSKTIEGYPTRSQVGRRFSNLAIWAECAQSIPDSQSGYRVYPLGLVEAVRCRSSGFAFESEIITRTIWAGGQVRSVPIAARYHPLERRVSHYRPWIDSLRCAALHLRLVGRTLNPWPHRKTWLVQDTEAGPTLPWYRRLARWVNPKKVLDDLRHDGVGRVSAAAGFS